MAGSAPRVFLLLLASLAPQLPPQPVRAMAAASCGGTLLELQVQQRGSMAIDRFRFNLGLEAEAVTQAEALNTLKQRLAALRARLTPLVNGPLTIPSPGTYRSGASLQRQHASTTVSGLVTKANYSALIEAVGGLPGVDLRSFQALPSHANDQALQASLLRETLAEGRRQADVTAKALGLHQVRLLRVSQRADAPVRPLPYARAAAAAFQPDEAVAPEQLLTLSLDYCLD